MRSTLELIAMFYIIVFFLVLQELASRMKISSFGWELPHSQPSESSTEKDCVENRYSKFLKIRKTLFQPWKVQDSDNDGTYVSEGNKTLLIYYNYPVKSFDGKKYFVIATTSWIGGKNFFLGKFNNYFHDKVQRVSKRYKIAYWNLPVESNFLWSKRGQNETVILYLFETC